VSDRPHHPADPPLPDDPVVRPVPVVLDARGLRCPLPVIRVARAAMSATAGTVIEVWATDPAARADIPAWCRMRGQHYLGEVDTDGDHAAYRVLVVRTAAQGSAANDGGASGTASSSRAR
jgi:tRNA 2-thiouridine synthesizing protein A